MGILDGSRSSTTRVQLLCLLHLSLLPLLPIVAAQYYSSNPSTNWTLSDYYRYNASDYSSGSNGLWFSMISNYTTCIQGNTYLELLNQQDKGLYGIATGIDSAHTYMPYTVYFSLYFVISAENVCLQDGGNGTNISAYYYLSLVALNAFGYVRDPNLGQVVWTANPYSPVTENACLLLNDSDLTLVDYPDSNLSSPQTVWQVSTGAKNVSLTISFEGNVVLLSYTTNPPSVPLWESFLQPADTLMVLQVLKNTSTLTVNSSFAKFNSGNYTLAVANGSLVLYARLDARESTYGSPYWVWPNSSIVSDDKNISFAAFCWDSINQLRLYLGSDRSSDNYTEYRGMVSPEFCSTIPKSSDTAMQITGLNQSINATYATFLRLDADGDLRAYTVDNTTSAYPGNNAVWRAFYSVFNSTPCDLPLYCGFYGMCDPHGSNGSYCRCNYSGDPRLTLADTSNNKSGCNPENKNTTVLWDIQKIAPEANTCLTPANITACSSNVSNCEVQFLSVDNVHYFSLNFTQGYQIMNDSADCWDECNRSCFCTAAFWNESGKSCYLIMGRLGTIQDQGSMQGFIKYVNITRISPPHPPSSFPWKVVVIGPVLAATLLVAFLFLVYWRCKRAHKLSELQKELLLLLSRLDCSNIERFTWKQMYEYTCGFSDLLGAGGFGRVFRGALPDGTAIAVKQLDQDGSQGQGDKEFIAEVSILSRIHHAHLVRLIGFCLEGTHRILVYEYMDNGSLDAWLFRNASPIELHEAHNEPQQYGNMNEKKNKRRELLTWKTRSQIALGTAKGLAYLHEECEEKVMHMDLKPQNILLGRNFVAKISDFGMSRRTAREQTSVMTVMRGTPGYLAPEWLLDCAITEKCDVYSFGIVLLELVSGRKAKDLRAVKQKLSMRPLKESVMLDFVDERLRYGCYSSDVNEKDAVRMVEVALLCVRTDPTKRPAISSVALMLEGKEEVLQEVPFDEDDDVPQQGMVAYPSAMNRAMMRTQPQQQEHGKLDLYSSFTSLIDDYSVVSDIGSSTIMRNSKKYFSLEKS